MSNKFYILILLLLTACSGIRNEKRHLANELEHSLVEYILEPWYPRCLDTVYGGYIADFEYDWTVSESSQEKSLVNQTRHLWTTAFIFDHYPQEKQFLEYAAHGFEFIRDHLVDEQFGGFYQVVRHDGSADSATLNSKTIYGQAFAVHGLAKYYSVSGDKSALDLAIEGFHWMDRFPHDKKYGGYFEILDRSGRPKIFQQNDQNPVSPPPGLPVSPSPNHSLSPSPTPPLSTSQNPLSRLKEFNSSLHVMEALTELYHVWPDSLLQERLEEMYLLFRDTFIHPDGYLKLYFYPDWTLVPDEEMRRRGGGDAWHTQHITFGHDVETAFLLLEAAHALGLDSGEDPRSAHLAKQLVDHALANGWDEENGGFYYIGYKQPDGSTTIYDNKKAFWVESEGLNALMLMYTLYPEDPKDYFGKFQKQWEYIDTWLIDKEHGGWYSYGLDTAPESKTGTKSNNWKTTYHDVRGMVRPIEILGSKN